MRIQPKVWFSLRSREKWLINKQKAESLKQKALKSTKVRRTAWGQGASFMLCAFSFLPFHKLPLGFLEFAMRVLLFCKNGSAHVSEKNIDIKPAE
jgi:hypothetical protein